jgi:hypothetical protein
MGKIIWTKKNNNQYQIVATCIWTRKIDFCQNFDSKSLQFYFKSELLIFWGFFWGALCLSRSKIEEFYAKNVRKRGLWKLKLGVVQKLCGQNLGRFWPPTPLTWT